MVASFYGAYSCQAAGHFRQPMGDNMDDLAFALNPTADPQHAR
jgi:hypothetical protein